MSTATPETQVTDRRRDPMFRQMGSLPRPFWMVNIMEMFERLAYYGVRVVIPIYIAQADEIGGLHFTAVQKGEIFLWWALVQSLTPWLFGGFADRYGFKKTIAVSVAVKALGYLLMATQREYYPFLLGCCTLALGTAIFKPGVQGTMCQVLSKRNSSVGWGTFYMLVNIGGFLGPPLAHFLYGISWPAVFYGCAGIVSLNFLMLLTYKELPSGDAGTSSFFATLWTIIVKFFNARLIVFVLIMSGFWLMFMQLFDMLPNFIVDWVNSTWLVETLKLPHFMLQLNSTRGDQLAQEWMINANPGLIILLVVFMNWLVSRMRRTHSIFIGIVIASVGLVLAGFTRVGVLCIGGILVFSIGEMLSSPKMNEYLGVIAPPGEKGLYMGYANVPQGIGWGVGSLAAGHAYDQWADKARLAQDYLANNFNLPDVPRTEAMETLVRVAGSTHREMTQILWNLYHPFKVWIPFAAVGVISALAMLFYSRWVRRYEEPDV
jgi:POT family proton-dependent oligopeptide transporter